MESPRQPKRKLAWFREGVTALRIAAPDAGPVYRCPLCLRDFTRPEELTLEHVPPRSVGGRPLVLTCRACNSISGHTLDAALAQRLEVDAFLAGLTAVQARWMTGDHSVNCEFRLEEDSYSFQVADRNHPERWAALQQHLETWVATGAQPDSVNVRFWLPRADPGMERASWIRAGYLAAFAALGYRYILDAALDPVRRQIAEPRTDVLGYGEATTDEPAGVPQLIYVREPAALRGFVVRFGLKGVSLPAPGDRGFYPRMNEHAKARQGRTVFRGLLVPWPTQPTFALDFSPPGRFLPPP